MRPIDGTHKGLFAIRKSVDGVPLREIGEDLKEQASFDNKDPLDSKNADIFSETTHSSTTSSSDLSPSTNATTPDSTPKDTGLAVDVFPPWDIQSIQEGLGGRYDRDTIVDMLQKCRGDIDRAFSALLGEKFDAAPEKKVAPGPTFNSSIQMSRESSPFSTGSKRSAEDSEDSDEPRPAVRRVRPKRRIVSNLTLGVGISFRDDQNELVSLNLRMKAEADAEKANAESGTDDAQESSDQSASGVRRGPRRSGRLSKPRPVQA